ncbi:response regulator [Phototrophicus methaneseepsis]|uniref:Response regulator n=1 Tax=Phototrophicus methaneseepsis TaxID=2710758 RepID=A0A7S8E979_9CHLR|nr:response regulator [Phototrophicus methaneseepsis]QPC82598.1 response regulator [Phototrophicus methaneseepsis]
MTSKIRIFIVNDQKAMCKLWQRLIDSQDDMECIGSAYDGDTAVEEAVPLQPDLVLMDVMMPGIDGYEAAQRIQAGSPSTQTIICSARTDIHERAKEIGAVAALILPVMPESLIALLRKFGSNKHPEAWAPPLS